MAYKYKYNGKEWQGELGLDLYDYGARNYDASLGRWMNIDGMAEKYLSNSPYHYADNNPVLNYDVDGNFFVDGFSRTIASSFQSDSQKKINQNNQTISSLQTMLSNSSHMSIVTQVLTSLVQTLNNNNSELQAGIDEVNKLDISSQGYAIEDAGATATSGQTFYDSGVVKIKAPLSGGYGLLGHELKHAFGFDQGTESISHRGTQVAPAAFIGLELSDEWNAYKRQIAIEPGRSRYATYSELDNDATGPYSKHPRTGPTSVSQHALVQTILNSNASQTRKDEELNRLACRLNQVIRINNKTYDGN